MTLKKQTAGDAFRTVRNNPVPETPQEAARRELAEKVNQWFQDQADALPATLEKITADAASGVYKDPPAYAFSHADSFWERSLSDHHFAAINIEQLSGFQHFDAVCRELDINFRCTVSSYMPDAQSPDQNMQWTLGLWLEPEKPYTPKSTSSPKPPKFGR